MPRKPPFPRPMTGFRRGEFWITDGTHEGPQCVAEINLVGFYTLPFAHISPLPLPWPAFDAVPGDDVVNVAQVVAQFAARVGKGTRLRFAGGKPLRIRGFTDLADRPGHIGFPGIP